MRLRPAEILMLKSKLSELSPNAKLYLCQWPKEMSQYWPLKLSHFSRVKMIDSVWF